MKRLIQEVDKEESYVVFTKAQGEQRLEQKDQENGKDGEKEEENRQNLSSGEQFAFADTIFAFNEKSKQYKSQAQ